MRYGCAQCRDELTLGPEELSHLARARLAAHLGACDDCRAHAARWAEAIGAARAWAPAPSAAERDAMLDRICARREPVRRAFVPARRAVSAGLLAAGALVGLLLARVGGEALRPPAASSAPSSSTASPGGASSSAASSSAARADAPAPAPLAPEPRPAAEAPPPRMPAGPVRVGPEVVRTAPEPRGNRASPSMAVKRRVRRAAPIAAQSAAPTAPSAPAPAPPPEPPRQASPAEALYGQAEAALAQGRPAAAARLLEELVEATPDAPEAQAARLELGRLYAGPLRLPSRAVIHLSAFVASEPEPSARTAAKVLLCRLVAPAERERICWPGLALRE